MGYIRTEMTSEDVDLPSIIDVREFGELGYLQELNRQFLHPLGLALSIEWEEGSEDRRLGVIFDVRDDPEGAYGDFDENAQERAKWIQQEHDVRARARMESRGFVIQPLTMWEECGSKDEAD